MSRWKPCCWSVLLALLAPAVSAQNILYTLTGERPGDHFGWAIANLGDLNGDGDGDFAVGAPYADYAGSDSGAVFVISGGTGTPLFRINGPAAMSFFGHSVAAAGDVNGDGTMDIIAGAPGHDGAGTNAGYAGIYSGTNGARLRQMRGLSADDFFGWSVTGNRDFDGDGNARDVAVGAPGDLDTLAVAGTVRVFNGASGAVIRSLSGSQAGERFGMTVLGVSDIDQDGSEDVVVGSPFWDRVGAMDAGASHAFSTATGVLLHQNSGAIRSSHFGISMATVTDLTGGPAEEYVVGARFELDRGRAHILNGNTGDTFRTHWGFVRSVWFGQAVGNAGDVDADGVSDVVFGAPLHGVVPGDLTNIRGQVRVVSGATGHTLFSQDGITHQDWFGFSVSGVGNVDSAAGPYDDYAAGAPLASGGRGEVRVFAGGQSSLSALILGLSTANGGRQDMNLDAGPTYGGRTYLLVGTASWTRPGFQYGSVLVPLNPDPYFLFTVGSPGAGFITPQLGTLDASGRATAQFVLPSGMSPNLIGLTLNHAFVVLQGSQALFASNPLPVFMEF